MSSTWQQILALDARYNAYRAPNNPSFRPLRWEGQAGSQLNICASLVQQPVQVLKLPEVELTDHCRSDGTLYIRRRSQLLRENAKQQHDPQVRKLYIRLRSQVLGQRYGFLPSEGSVKSRTLSVRSGSQATLEGDNLVEPAKRSPLAPSPPTELYLRSQSVPRAESAADSSASILDNYTFEGIHHIFEHHGNAVTRVRFAHDERYRLAVSSMDGNLSICTLTEESNRCSLVWILRGHKLGVTDSAWSISNDLLVSCSLDATVRLWDPNSGECIRTVEDTSGVLCCVFQPLNNNLVVTGNVKGLVQVLNISTGKYLRSGTCRMAGAATCLCCDSTGRLLWVGDDKGNVFSFIMDLTSGKLVKARRIIISADHPVTSVNARTYVSREFKDPMLLISVAANMLCLYRVVNAADGSIQIKRRIPVQHSGHTIRSSFFPLISFRSGVCVVSGSEDGCVYLFDMERSGRGGSGIKKLSSGHNCAVLDSCFNLDESFLAVGDVRGRVVIWKRMKLESS